MIPTLCHVPSKKQNKTKIVELFSYPEYSEERNQIEFRF